MISECPDGVPDDISPISNNEKFYRSCKAGMIYINPVDISNSVKEIKIIGTQINTVLNDTFAKKQTCQILSLAFNMIHTIEIYAFRDMFSLRELHLNNNRISVLQRGVFDYIEPWNPLVTHVHLQRNQLTRIALGLFSKLTRLTYLDLQANPLGTLSQELRNELNVINTILILIPIGKSY